MKFSEKTYELVRTEQKCIGCKACMRGCPMLDKFCENPRALLQELNENGTFELPLPYSCMLCGYCRTVCPVGVDFGRLFLEMRRDSIRQTGGKLGEDISARSVRLHQRLSFSPLFTTGIQELQSDTIFFPGCALLSYSPRLVQATYDYLREQAPGIGFYNKCCGKPTRFLGDEDRFRKYYAELALEFRHKGIRTIITGCQNCYKTLGENSPEIEVVSLYEFIAKNGLPRSVPHRSHRLSVEFTLHDPCPTRDEDPIHDAVREIVRQLGLPVAEMPEFSRGTTLCCGSGGMVPLLQPPIGKAHRTRRAQEAPTEYILTYCQECVESMRRGGKKALHLLDLLFTKDVLAIPQENQTTVRRWRNRYSGKQITVKS